MWNFPLFPERASSHAGRGGRRLLRRAGRVRLFFTALICFLIIFFAVQYRRGLAGRPLDPPRGSSTVLEVALDRHPLRDRRWACSSGRRSSSSTHVRRRRGDASEVYVVGKQWMWKLQHPEGKREINELHVPLGRPVQLTMISQDVIHSFYVPAFRIKQDVLPGRYTSLWFQPTKVGDVTTCSAPSTAARTTRGWSGRST